MPGLMDLLDPVVSIINKLVPDKAAAAQFAAQLKELALNGQIQQEMVQLQATTADQSGVDKVEAGSTSVFVAGWRPMIGWVCAAALAEQYVARPMILWVSTLTGHPIPVAQLPALDDQLWQLMTGMLGMGALRTYEKLKGVAGNH